jgi:hypothetical protein
MLDTRRIRIAPQDADRDASTPAIIGRGVELGPVDISKVIPVYRFAKPTRALSKQT